MFCLPSEKGPTLEGENLLLMEQIFSFKSRPLFERRLVQRNENRKSPKVARI